MIELPSCYIIPESAFLLEASGWSHKACLSSECSLDMFQGPRNVRKGAKDASERITYGASLAYRQRSV